MQASCPDCGQEYEFEASSIPADGYDAQCSSCGSIIFIKPKPDGSTTVDKVPGRDSAVPSDEVSVTCPHCAVVYQFAKAEISDEGYDAQCTECEGIFFVEGQGDLKELLALSDELGEPATLPEGVSTKKDFERISSRRRGVVKVALGGGGLRLVTVGVTYSAFPEVFDATLGPVIGVKAGDNSAALEQLEQAQQAMLPDTSEGYESAQKSLESALVLDPELAEAIALKGLMHVFKGGALQAAGRGIGEAGVRAQKEIRRIKRLPRRKRKKQKAVMAELKEQVAASGDESKKKFEAAGRELRKGLSALQLAEREHVDSPMLKLALGLYFVTEPDGGERAAQLHKQATGLLNKAPAEVEDKRGKQWAAYLEGRVLLQAPHKTKESPAAFQAALQLEPTFQRARYGLALAQQKLEERDAAMATLKMLLAQVPQHARAQALLERLEEEAAAKQKKAGKKRKKRKRSKKSPQ